jgi:PAS domain-containing protein
VFNGYEVEHDFLNIGRKVILLNARQIFRATIGSHIVLLAMEDITERKRAEEALHESESRFRAAAEGSLDAFYIFKSVRDEKGQIIDFEFVDLNAHGEKLIGMPRQEIISQRLCELIPINRTDGFFDKYVRVVETGETLDEEFPINAEQIHAV